MRVRSLRASCAALVAGLLVAGGLVVAPAAQAANNPNAVMVGPYYSRSDCRTAQRAYQSSWTRVIYPCYNWVGEQWVFVYIPVRH